METTMSRRHRSFLLAIVLLAPSVACDDADDSGDETPPAAPTGLMGEPLSGGAHLTWTDNSDDETEFMVQRKLEGDAAYTTVATVPFDTTQYHDAPLESGVTYMYMVMAMNDAGESESAEVTFAAP
jgi:hypothetical protein